MSVPGPMDDPGRAAEEGGEPSAGRGDGPGSSGRPPADAKGSEPDPATDLIRFWYRRHADRVYRYARWRTGARETAEEVVSDVFLEAWRSREDYDAQKGSVESWLLGIARNVVRRERRKAARRAELRDDRELDDLASRRPGPEEAAIRGERRERLLEAVWALPREDRDLVALAYGADFSRRRIARMLDLTPEAVRTRLHRVLRRLRERLEEQGE